MAKGTAAKQWIEDKIIAAFGEAYVGTFDKKIYINAPENGETVQVSLTMTCPKVPVGANNPIGTGGMDFENMPATATKGTEFKPAEITTEETENIRKLLAELGL